MFSFIIVNVAQVVENIGTSNRSTFTRCTSKCKAHHRLIADITEDHWCFVACMGVYNRSNIMHEQSTNHISQSHPLRRTRFAQYQASLAALG